VKGGGGKTAAPTVGRFVSYPVSYEASIFAGLCWSGW